MLFALSSLLVLAVAANAASIPAGERIVGGHAVSIESFPYQVAMLYYGQQLCGGSIIGPKHILTAAHCTRGINNEQISVRVGSTYHARGGEVIKVSKVTQHEAYNPSNYDNDMSILTLEEEIVYNESAQPVTLTSSEPTPGTWCDVTGWGYLKENGQQAPNLQLVQVPIISRDECKEMYGRYEINDNMICAGFKDGERDACQGDSGGPLAVDGVQVGVVSWGVGCARPSKPGIYSNVASLRTWISTNTGI